MKARAVRTTLILILIGMLPLITAFGQSEYSQPIPVLSPAELDSLVAPIALYPDPLLSQVLVASTYPLEIVQAVQWLEQNSRLDPTAQQIAASEQNWDASVQSLVLIPEALHLLADNIQWATDLGNSFIAQQTDVMDAIQRLRGQALASGVLRSNEEELVTTMDYGPSTAVEIEPAYPQVVYVPLYEPTTIWGDPVYPYPIIRRPRMPIIVQAGIVSYAPCISVGYALNGWGGWSSWGWEPNWFGRTVVINNVFIQRYGPQHYRGNTNPVPVTTAEKTVWIHDPGHRRNVPYVSAREDNTNRRENRRSSSSGAQATVRTLTSTPPPSQVARPVPMTGPEPIAVPSPGRPPVTGSANGPQATPPNTAMRPMAAPNVPPRVPVEHAQGQQSTPPPTHVPPAAQAPAAHATPAQATSQAPHPAAEHGHSEAQTKSGGTKPH